MVWVVYAKTDETGKGANAEKWPEETNLWCPLSKAEKYSRDSLERTRSASWLHDRICPPIPTLHFDVAFVTEDLKRPRLQTAWIAEALLVNLADEISKTLVE